VSPAKTAEPIEMPFGLWDGMGPRNRVRWESTDAEVALATNFGTKVAISGFVRTIATRQLVMERGVSGRPTECRYCRTLHLRDVAMATIFWLSIYGMHVGSTWRIRLNRPCVAAMRLYVKLL